MQYQRILLKLSGEALSGGGKIIDEAILARIVKIVKSVQEMGIELAIVIGGGNIFRGASLTKIGISSVVGDHMGMLGTVINALAINEILNNNGVEARVMSGLAISGGVCGAIDPNQARADLAAGKVVIFAAGTGAPCFSTDSGAALRAIEIGADCVFKATKVDGVYDSDPVQNKAAVKYDVVSFDEVIEKGLKVMDVAAFALCREHNLPIWVFSLLADEGNLAKILSGDGDNTRLGTIIRR